VRVPDYLIVMSQPGRKGGWVGVEAGRGGGRSYGRQKAVN
jgi:hypothetical protein